jgi:glycosyltransferase involved in cell wall biosynthesis
MCNDFFKKPLITVLMPVYNAQDYLHESIASVLSQTMANFEFLIFNDGSTDSSLEIIKSFNDPRIVVFDYKKNSGYVKHLNFGISIAKGKYIARMDADDISVQNRFELQCAFMEANPEIGVCGSNFKFIGSKYVVRYPKSHGDISIYLLYDSAIGHPTAFIRTNVLRESEILYDENYIPAEDYQLWSRLINYTKFANLNKVLLHYRQHNSQISSSKSSAQSINRDLVRYQNFECILNRSILVYDKAMIRLLFNLSLDLSERQVLKLLLWKNEIINSLKISEHLKRIKISNFLDFHITRRIINRRNFSLKFAKLLLKKRFFMRSNILLVLKFYLKCFLSYKFTASKI